MSCWPANITGVVFIFLIMRDLIINNYIDIPFHSISGILITLILWLLCITVGEGISAALLVVPVAFIVVFMLTKWMIAHPEYILIPKCTSSDNTCNDDCDSCKEDDCDDCNESQPQRPPPPPPTPKCNSCDTTSLTPMVAPKVKTYTTPLTPMVGSKVKTSAPAPSYTHSPASIRGVVSIDSNDPGAMTAARSVAKAFDKRTSNNSMSFAKFISGIKQVVDGILYHLTLEITPSTCVKGSAYDPSICKPNGASYIVRARVLVKESTTPDVTILDQQQINGSPASVRSHDNPAPVYNGRTLPSPPPSPSPSPSPAYVPYVPPPPPPQSPPPRPNLIIPQSSCDPLPHPRYDPGKEYPRSFVHDRY